MDIALTIRDVQAELQTTENGPENDLMTHNYLAEARELYDQAVTLLPVEQLCTAEIFERIESKLNEKKSMMTTRMGRL